jgi:diguanylate cyclase (GGDEF)-like protein
MPDVSTTTSSLRFPYLVIISGERIGAGYVLSKPPVTIGRHGASILADPGDKSISRLHATIELDDKGYCISDNDSTNGTMVNGKQVSRQPLANGDRIEIGKTIFKYILPNAKIVHEKVSDRSHIDRLTGLFNLSRFHELLAEALAEVRLFKSNLSLILIDADDFGKVNELYGKEFGDRIINDLSELLSSILLEDQELFRLENEDFAILLRGASARYYMDIAQMIRQAVEVFDFRYDEQATALTVSIGVKFMEAGQRGDIETKEFLETTRKCVEKAKEKGGNSICGPSSGSA